ncbi:hypothetical protein POL68_20445 [Stigmatella sp. ncwal1]|uniref:Uncharacterized protein n=1 Tax=Stigmatella ashevillensis TaxID=2995309 RepID=A0ABT5DBF7_9BACT|nr:hypothetical protein [Stigmatella ashevillena]MDC0710856.1 hypothetical protein [Stigmatella ashevillena]
MFALSVGNPACTTVRDPSDATMNEALQTICSLDDQAFLEWSDLKFRLGYKYDLSIMLDDIVAMVLEVDSSEAGTYELDWPSSGFPYHWTLRWNGNEMEIVARARDEPGAKDLTGREQIHIDRRGFLQEWQTLLRLILSCLENAGYGCGSLEGDTRLRQAAIQAR